LADNGFAFITEDDSQGNSKLVTPLPEQYAGLLAEQDQASGLTLQALLKTIPANGEISTFSLVGQQLPNGWSISAARFKPLGWTIVAAVPNDDLTRPAIELRNRLAVIFLAILLISLLVAWALPARITRPL